MVRGSGAFFFYNILLLLTIIMTYAVETSVCERGFALMNNAVPVNNACCTALHR